MNRYNYKKLSAIVMSITVLGTVLTGCGTSSQVSANSSSSNTASSSPKELVFYSAQGYDDAMAKAFQAKTGIKVNLVDMSTGPLAAKIEAEKSNSHWDVAWFDGDATMQTLDNEGLLMQGWTPGDASGLTELGQSLVPADKSYYPTGVTAAAAIGVNSKLLPASDYPKDWQDLLKPAFKNGLAMNDPSVSGPTYPYVAGILNLMGDSQGKQFFASLKSNGLKVGQTNSVEIQSLLSGQVKAVTVQDTALISSKVDGNPIDIIYPPSGVFTLPSVIGINKNAPNAETAKQFVEFVLSQEGQKVMLDPKNGGSDSYFNPVVSGVEANSTRQKDGINWLKVDPVQSSQKENDIKKWFNDAITH